MSDAIRRSLQHASTLLIDAQGTPTEQVLKRVPITPGESEGKGQYDEQWLQYLVQRHPSTLPVEELEPGFGRLIPVGMELPTPAGSVDNLFVTSEGQLVVVECKLWRNPEARRRVLAQIIDYASGMSSWNYDDLDKAISRCRTLQNQPVGKPLLEIVRESESDLNESRFIDAVQRNLELGRMLLLVVGDGVREGAESLKAYLQQHAGFHFTLGLVEVAVHELAPGRLIVQPRVLARTLNIVRAVVSLENGRVVAGAVKPSEVALTSATPTTLTEEAFYEQLTGNSPRTVSLLKAFVSRARDSEIAIDFAKKSAILRFESPTGKVFSLGGIDVNGNLSTFNLGWAPSSVGLTEIAHWYLESLARIVGATVRRTPKESQWYLVMDGTTLPPAEVALTKAEDWINLIDEYKQRILQGESARGG